MFNGDDPLIILNLQLNYLGAGTENVSFSFIQILQGTYPLFDQ